MRAGQLDSLITIKAYTVTGVDDFNAPTGSWGTLAQVWADARFLTGTEGYELNAQTAEIRIRFRIRYLSSVTTDHRITYDSQEYRIETVDQTRRREGITEIIARRTTPAPA